jgi:hypothetical protein
LLAAALFATSLFAQPSLLQPALRLKTREIRTVSPVDDTFEAASQVPFLRTHLLVQFNHAPTGATIDELKRRGLAVLQSVPVNGFLVAVEGRVRLHGLGVRYAAPIDPTDKISPLINPTITRGDPAAADAFFLTEFHPDVDMNYARALLLNLGFELRENSDLHPRQLMVRVDDRNRLAEIAALDEAAYVFPASDELVKGTPVHACAGAIIVAATMTGVVAQMIPTNGPGWDGVGLNATTLNYVFSQITTKVAAGTAQSEIQRAMAEWSKVIKLAWIQTSNSTAARTVNILFASGVHGDGYPFDGPGGVLAHTFYPAPPNPEPIAGDMHFDNAESWRIGANTDIYSVALHELGHALGLGHSDNPADVMYPYYKLQTTLAAGDKAAIRTMYAAQDSTPSSGGSGSGSGTPAPLQLTLIVPPGSTSSAGFMLNGSVSGGSGTISVTWTSNQGSSGAATMLGTNWTIPSIPLALGSNVITVTATDSSTHVSSVLTITRTQPPPPPPPGTPRDTTPPTLTITSPGTTTVSTSLAALVFSGWASDNVGVTSVTWSTNTWKSGTASGTAQWSTAPIPLLVGSNTVTIKASDAAGNIAWRSVVVTRY